MIFLEEEFVFLNTKEKITLNKNQYCARQNYKQKTEGKYPDLLKSKGKIISITGITVIF